MKETYRNPGFLLPGQQQAIRRFFLLGVVTRSQKRSPMTITRRAATIGGLSLLVGSSISTFSRAE
jgi:hypothetical protein